MDKKIAHKNKQHLKLSDAAFLFILYVFNTAL